MKYFNLAKYTKLMQDYSRIAGKPEITKDEPPLSSLIDLLDRFRHHDEYYTVVNVPEQEISWDLSVDTYLQYDLSQLDRKRKLIFFDDLIHPFAAQWDKIFMAGFYQCILDRKFDPVEYLRFRMVTNLPVRRQNGTYVLVKKILMPFEFDEKKLMVSHINSYFLVDKYKGEPLNPRLFIMGNPQPEYEKILFQESLQFTTLTQKNVLSTELDALADKILKIQEINKSTLPKNVLNKAQESKKGTGALDYKPLSRLKKKLTPYFQHDTTSYTREQQLELDQWLPDLNDKWRLVHFANDAGLLPLLKLLRKK